MTRGYRNDHINVPGHDDNQEETDTDIIVVTNRRILIKRVLAATLGVTLLIAIIAIIYYVVWDRHMDIQTFTHAVVKP